MNQDYIPFSEIILEIGKICKQKATGTLFVSTSDNRSAQIMLDRGEIVFVFFSGKRGQEALMLMSKIEEGRFRFQEGGVVARRMALPSNQEILQALSGAPSQSVTSSWAAPAVPEKKAPTGGGLSAEQKSVLEACMADCIGPMAAIICEDHFSSIGDLKSAIEALAEEIPSAAQAKKFREMVAERLG